MENENEVFHYRQLDPIENDAAEKETVRGHGVCMLVRNSHVYAIVAIWTRPSQAFLIKMQKKTNSHSHKGTNIRVQT